jgi:hypothetical protein
MTIADAGQPTHRRARVPRPRWCMTAVASATAPSIGGRPHRERRRTRVVTTGRRGTTLALARVSAISRREFDAARRMAASGAQGTRAALQIAFDILPRVPEDVRPLSCVRALSLRNATCAGDPDDIRVIDAAAFARRDDDSAARRIAASRDRVMCDASPDPDPRPRFAARGAPGGDERARRPRARRDACGKEGWGEQ